MSSSPTPLLKLEQQASGEHNDTWGDNLNATLAMVENAIAKRTALATTGGDTTLTDTQFVDNQARNAALDISGVLVSNANIIVPARSKPYIVRNQTTGSFTVTIKTSGGSGVAVTQGAIAFLWCDGTNVVAVGADSATLGGFAAAAYARLAANQTFTAANRYAWTTLADGATVTIDCNAITSNCGLVPAGNRTIAFSNETDGQTINLYITQDSTGNRTLTWPSNIIWQNGAAPTLSTAANATDYVRLTYRAGSINKWYGTVTNNIVAGGSSTIPDIIIGVNSQDVDVYALAGQPAGAVTFTVRIANGVIVSASSTQHPALSLVGFAASSVITLIIGTNAYIIGRGGQGGNGGCAGGFSGNDAFGEAGRDGFAGGPAIRLPSASTTLTIQNSGHIWGGGGGGGGGGATSSTNADNLAVGGGGGGGAGSGIAGQAASIRSAAAVSVTASHGTPGGSGRLGTGGSGGAANQTGTASGGAGGAGGNYGAAGSAGASPTAQALDSAGGAAGAAGKAVDYNGGSAPTISPTGDIAGATS